MRKQRRRWLLLVIVLVMMTLNLGGCFTLYSGRSYGPGRHPATTPNTYQSWCLQWKSTVNCHFTSRGECEYMAQKEMYRYDNTRCYRGYP